MTELASKSQLRMSFLRIGPTELRIILAAGTLFLVSKPTVTLFGFGPFQLFDVGGTVAALGLLVTLMMSTARTTAALYRSEPLPRTPERRASSRMRPS